MPIPPSGPSDCRPSPNCPGTSHLLEVPCHREWTQGPWILAVFWMLEVVASIWMALKAWKVWKVWIDEKRSGCDLCVEMRKP